MTNSRESGGTVPEKSGAVVLADEKKEEEEEEDALRCGYCSWRPGWLQCMNTPRFLLACVCWFTFTQGFVVNGIVYTNFSTWQRRYGYTSIQLAWISSAYDLVASVITLAFGYIGQWMHNGRILCISAYFMSIGSFFMTLPQLLSGEYQLGPREIDVCDLSGNSTVNSCDAESSDSGYYVFLIIAQMFHAVGGSAVYTLAIPFMDDQIKTKNTPLYIGLMQGCAALGPALGYILGGAFLNVYVDISVDPDDIEIGPEDPRWVGAWWIGLLYSGFAALTVAFLIGCFPRELPSAKKNRIGRQTEAHKGAGVVETSKANFGRSGQDVLTSLRLIFTNPAWVFLTIGGTIESGAVTGFGAFLPKVMQYQFAQPPGVAAALAGMVVVPGAAGGQILGGLIPKYLKLRMRGLLIQCLVCSIVGVFLSFQFFIRCDTIPIAGITVPYFNQSFDPDNVDVVHPCNEPCNCTLASYDPVCGVDGVEYFTPCHGGCTADREDTDGGQFYSGCSCISESGIDTGQVMGNATSGVCPTDCTAIGPFLFLFLLLNLATFISSTAGQAATIRCVPDAQRAFGYGVRNVFVRLLGNVPGPILFGAIFDTACLLHQRTCDEEGSCWVYDTEFISEGIVWAGVVVKSVSGLAFLLALLCYKPPDGEQDDIQLEVESKGNSAVLEVKEGLDNPISEHTYM